MKNKKDDIGRVILGIALFIILMINIGAVLKGFVFLFILFVLYELIKIDDDDNTKFPRK